MGEAGHDGLGVRLGEVHQPPLQVAQQAVDAVDRRPQPQAYIGGDLVVARAPGVQSLAGVAHQVREPLLDVEVYVLQVEGPLEALRLDFVANLRHAALDVGQVLRRQHADRMQHVRVGERAANVELGEPAVEADRSRIALDQLVYRFAETAGPGLRWVVLHGCGRQGGALAQHVLKYTVRRCSLELDRALRPQRWRALQPWQV
jgi:hypothetical protein